VGVLPESAASRYAKDLHIALVPLQDEWADLSSFIWSRNFESLPDFGHQLIEVLLENAAREAAGFPSHHLTEARIFAD
jgi:DNA-binding transcriptional LysR family regulator